jgi:hypothetical protein
MIKFKEGVWRSCLLHEKAAGDQSARW